VLHNESRLLLDYEDVGSAPPTLTIPGTVTPRGSYPTRVATDSGCYGLQGDLFPLECSTKEIHHQPRRTYIPALSATRSSDP
jgi:hypothetical protein